MLSLKEFVKHNCTLLNFHTYLNFNLLSWRECGVVFVDFFFCYIFLDFFAIVLLSM